MLLTDFKRVRELDSKIGAIHRQLADLYQERLSLMEDEKAISKSILPEITNPERTYHLLTRAWERCGVVIPTYKAIKAKLTKAEKIRQIIAESHPEIADALEIIIVPPSKLLKLPISSDVRQNQGLTDLPDFINTDVTHPRTTQKWSIMLAYSAAHSLYCGSPKRILETKSYMFAGYDMRGLGMREYIAMTLQKDALFDQESWTVLLKDSGKKLQVPYAGYRQGRYRIDMEEIDNVLDDDGFRPAIEV